jgi:HUS1 checkpoint protein
VERLSESEKWVACHLCRVSLKHDAAQDDEVGPNEDADDPDKLYTVLISTRSFLKFLNSHVVSTTTIACMPDWTFCFDFHSSFSGICQHHCVILYVYIGDVADAGGVLTFYIPAIVDDEM